MSLRYSIQELNAFSENYSILFSVYKRLPDSDWFDIKSGVAQGCPLSPLLFLIVAQGLKTSMDLRGVERP